jgi:hypothetical protein
VRKAQRKKKDEKDRLVVIASAVGLARLLEREGKPGKLVAKDH